MRIRSYVFGIVFAVLAASTIQAMRVYVPPEVYVDRASYIVLGTMKNVDKRKGTGTIKIKRFLKGKMDTDTVDVRFRKKKKQKKKKRKKGGLTIHSRPNLRGRAYREGQRGIWFLMPSAKGDDGRYKVSDNAYYRKPAAANGIMKTIKSLKRLPWSKPVEGLSARALVHQQGQARYRLVYLVLKNTSDKSMIVNRSSYHTQVKVTVHEPQRNMRTLDLTHNKKDNPIKKAFFIRLKPGESRYIPYKHGVNSGKLDKPGEYNISVCYTNKYDGSKAGLKDEAPVWTGRVCAPTVKVQVQPD